MATVGKVNAMQLIGIEFLQSQLVQDGFSAKVVFNERGAIFFPVTEEHRDQKSPGISYADEYQGNALAGMLSPGKWEIRNHRDFSELRVKAILAGLLSRPELSIMANWRVTYRGRDLSVRL